ncbi:hypothetical protein E4100_01975 [Soehngenia longivitae]|jgi:hypothetical protein|uniref:Peptidase S9 prolyl oligopeptidase catalytic domain-containing protein n=1 Tax=Soehngenia longivitae TaxID=2562294 RepID=A0A4Z0D906_9FIRM|nr:alpha/beta fold hydrolase [Soehngenia longivitae]TFZ41367.1 hypothetical protein E4100_01975 [Soehngenia longivitae]
MNLFGVEENKLYIENIPVLVIRPSFIEGNYPTVIFYHGFTSNKENQKFRAEILASLGYQIILPDSLYHGERGNIDYEKEVYEGVFWRIVLKNIEEYDTIKDFATEKLHSDPNRMAVMGHSMGGFTSSGIFRKDEALKTAIIVNGSCDYLESNKIFKNKLGIEDDEKFEEMERHISNNDPLRNIKTIVDRPLLLLHGEADSIVDINPQKQFYETAKKLYKNKELINLITYPNLNHHFTVSMLEKSAEWLNKYL